MTASFDPARPHGPRRPPTPKGMSETARLLAYEEIRQLAARYALAMDARDLEALYELWVEEIRPFLREPFETSFRSGQAGKVSFALVGNHVVNLLDADHAAGTVYCAAQFGDRDRWVTQTIAYEDTYERRDGSWYFTSRNHHLFFGADVELRPLEQPPAEWPKDIVGVGTVPYAWPTWQAFQNGD